MKEKEQLNQSLEYYSGVTSVTYSHRRYERPINNYIKYLFTTRLNFFLKIIKQAVGDRRGLSLFEVGCADGILFKKINQRLPEVFSHLVGIDITPDMVNAARAADIKNAVFFERSNEPDNEKYDILIEIGVHTKNLTEEIVYVKNKLKKDGYFIKSFSSRNSLHSRFKLKDKPWFIDLKTYPEYEKELQQEFIVVSVIPYGFFIPKLWSLPWPLALFLQKIVDKLLCRLLPNFYHEKLFLLKKRCND